MEEVFRCPNCGSSQTRFRVKTRDRRCYVCGDTWEINSDEYAMEVPERINEGGN